MVVVVVVADILFMRVLVYSRGEKKTREKIDSKREQKKRETKKKSGGSDFIYFVNTENNRSLFYAFIGLNQLNERKSLSKYHLIFTPHDLIFLAWEFEIRYTKRRFDFILEIFTNSVLY